jgi:hypothetical protein
MEALALALNRPAAIPVAVLDFKKLRRSIGSPARTKFGQLARDTGDITSETK